MKSIRDYSSLTTISENATRYSYLTDIPKPASFDPAQDRGFLFFCYVCNFSYAQKYFHNNRCNRCIKNNQYHHSI